MKEDLIKKIVDAAKSAIYRDYDNDNVDVVFDDVSGTVVVMYHSDDNSFPITDTGIKCKDVYKVRGTLAKELDNYYIGHCW